MTKCSYSKSFSNSGIPYDESCYRYQCGEDALPNQQFCILHCPDEGKNDSRNRTKARLIAKKIKNEAQTAVELVGISIKQLDLTTNATYKHDVIIVDCQIKGDIQSQGVEFQAGLYLHNTQVRGKLIFSDIKVTNNAHFEESQIGGNARFQHSQIGGTADFYQSQIGGNAHFQESQIGGNAHFQESQIGRDIYFQESQIGGDANFQESQIGGDADFEASQISGYAAFAQSQIGGFVDFQESQIGGNAYFEASHIGGFVDFQYSQISGKMIWRQAKITGECRMTAACLLQELDLSYISCETIDLDKTLMMQVTLINPRIKRGLTAKAAIWYKTRISGGIPEATLDISDSWLSVLKCENQIASRLCLTDIYVEPSGFFQLWRERLDSNFEQARARRLQSLIELKCRYQSCINTQEKKLNAELYRLFTASAAGFLSSFQLYKKTDEFQTPDIKQYAKSGWNTILYIHGLRDLSELEKWASETTQELFSEYNDKYYAYREDKKNTLKVELETFSGEPVLLGGTFWKLTALDLQNISFINCDLRYADFLSAKIDNTLFDACRFFPEKGKQTLYGHHKIINDARELADDGSATDLRDRTQNLSEMYSRFKCHFELAHDYPLAGQFHKQEMLLRLERIKLKLRRAPWSTEVKKNWQALKLRLAIFPERSMLRLYRYSSDFGLSWVRAFTAMLMWFLLGGVILGITETYSQQNSESAYYNNNALPVATQEQDMEWLSRIWYLGHKPLLKTFLPKSLSEGMGMEMQDDSNRGTNNENKRSGWQSAIIFIHFVGIFSLFILFVLCLRRRFKR